MWNCQKPLGFKSVWRSYKWTRSTAPTLHPGIKWSHFFASWSVNKKNYLIIGKHGLKNSGTLPGAFFRTLNLSPQASISWPNYCFILTPLQVEHAETTAPGRTISWTCSSYRKTSCYMLKICYNNPSRQGYMSKYNPQGILLRHLPETWKQFLSKNVKSWTIVYFMSL